MGCFCSRSNRIHIANNMDVSDADDESLEEKMENQEIELLTTSPCRCDTCLSLQDSPRKEDDNIPDKFKWENIQLNKELRSLQKQQDAKSNSDGIFVFLLICYVSIRSSHLQ